MEKPNVLWALVGAKSKFEDGKLTNEQVELILSTAFESGIKYKLFLCGEIIEKEATLQEMEEGFILFKKESSSYEDGNYCIIYSHEDGDLLFMPVLQN